MYYANKINMKKIIKYFAALFFITSCDPQPKYAQFEGTTQVIGKVINPRDTIGIDDTVKIRIELPDTVLYNGVKTGLFYDEKNCYLGLQLQKFDKTGAGNMRYAFGNNTLATIGSLNNNRLLFFQRIGNKLLGEYAFIPKSKGIFFIDQQLPGDLYANNEQYHLKFTFNYGNINRNHKILLDSIGAGTNFNLFLQDRINNGLEVYGFVVK
jgi:hypothetical protein